MFGPRILYFISGTLNFFLRYAKPAIAARCTYLTRYVCKWAFYFLKICAFRRRFRYFSTFVSKNQTFAPPQLTAEKYCNIFRTERITNVQKGGKNLE